MNRGKYILDADGQPVQTDDLLAWATWMDVDSNRQVAITKVGEQRVSTVFLGLDHSFSVGPPVLWETMIFGGNHDDAQWRYTSREEAERDHERIVADLRDDRDPTDPKDAS